MTISIHASARKHASKHSLSDADILHAAIWALWIEPLDDENPQRELRLGFDNSGRLLETVVLLFDGGNELIIHAMKARPQYIRLLG